MFLLLPFQYYTVMQVRENLAMDNETTFTRRKTYTISRFTVIFVGLIFCTSIVATALLIYNFATCPSYALPRSDVRGDNHVLSLNNGNNHVATANVHSSNTNKPGNILDLRLPRSIVPISYDIKLIPFLFNNNFTFTGEVKILVNVTESCKNITLHATALTIQKSDVVVRKVDDQNLNYGTPNSARIDIKSQYFVEPKQFYVIELNDTLQVGALYALDIKYTGVLNDLLQGFYRSSYNIGNESR